MTDCHQADRRRFRGLRGISACVRACVRAHIGLDVSPWPVSQFSWVFGSSERYPALRSGTLRPALCLHKSTLTQWTEKVALVWRWDLKNWSRHVSGHVFSGLPITCMGHQWVYLQPYTACVWVNSPPPKPMRLMSANLACVVEPQAFQAYPSCFWLVVCSIQIKGIFSHFRATVSSMFSCFSCSAHDKTHRTLACWHKSSRPDVCFESSFCPGKAKTPSENSAWSAFRLNYTAITCTNRDVKRHAGCVLRCFCTSQHWRNGRRKLLYSKDVSLTCFVIRLYIHKSGHELRTKQQTHFQPQGDLSG